MAWDGIMTRFYVFQEFDEDLAKDFVEWVHEHEKYRKRKLKVYINSPGGNIAALSAMLDAMATSHHEFHTIATGQAQSCGFILLISGDTRSVYKNTNLMSHQYSWGVQGKFHELSETSKQFQITHEWLLEHYQECSTKQLSQKYLDMLLGHSDYYPTCEELLQKGLIDEIL